ncbi:hypothetical protein ACVMB3_007078 [Sinorhizobium meliloti]
MGAFPKLWHWWQGVLLALAARGAILEAADGTGGNAEAVGATHDRHDVHATVEVHFVLRRGAEFLSSVKAVTS